MPYHVHVHDGMRAAELSQMLSHQVASSAFVALTRLGCGGFVSGYRSGVPKDDGQYAITKIGGKSMNGVRCCGRHLWEAAACVLPGC